ncbi:MAG: hypothetical protein OEO82_06205 [Gammaproteobacteria bacterium]|nr:hypothetical protein [Gammaproteobacteria bacterium]
MSLIIRLVLISLLLPMAANAQDVYVPEQLRDWQEWVLKDKRYRGCPFFFDRGAGQANDFVCAWPGTLELTVDAERGRFEQQWTVYAEHQWLPLPGDVAYWPHQVSANGRSVAVVARNNTPSIHLGPGSYRITGSFEWDERPGVLQIPASVGLVALTVNGEVISRPERNRAGIFLGERQRETQTRDTLETEVYRLITDNVPTRLTTQLRINVSGSVREESLGPLLPEGFVPLAINSQLPARLEPDGNLRLQIRPGRWVIDISARGPQALDAVLLPESASNLPDSEIWSYQSNDLLRVTAAEGLPPVDPEQANVPPGWRELPAYRVTPGDSLIINERSRGIVGAENQLMLERQMWLDFNGEGFIVSDAIGGTMRTGWRLDMGLPYELLSASEDDDNLLITKGQREGESGIELRQNNVNVDTLGRAAARGALPITGWHARLAGVSTVLHLPPGHKLLAAPGVDNAPASWVSQWQLLDFFLVLIITIGTWRLFGRLAGILALAALSLSFHEMNAPAWLWLNLLIAIALMRVAPAGRLRQFVSVYQALSAVLLVLALVPFIASQLRIAIYPQLEPQYGAPAPTVFDEVSYNVPPQAGIAGGPADADATRLREATSERRLAATAAEAGATLGEFAVAADTLSQAYSYSRYAPNAIVQAGPGKPSWRWNSYLLNWSGPVDAEQTMRLVILPRWAVTLLRFVEVLVVLLFTAVFAAEILQRRFSLPGGLRIGSAPSGGVLAIALLTGLMSVSPDAQAQLPDAEMLRELERRLLEPPECAPRCAEIVAADIAVSADAVDMSLAVHALEDVAVPLPGSEQGWRPTAILAAGTAVGQVLRDQGGSLWAHLSPGRHTLTMRGPVPAVDSLEIPFPAPPRVITIDSDGWFVAGIKDRRLLSGSLQLTRLRSDGGEDTAVRWESSRFPVFVEVARTVRLDLDWQVLTTVRRIAPTQGALTLDLPLIEGESVLTEGIIVRDGRAQIAMNPSQRAVSWSSTLPRTSSLAIGAEAGAAWQEIWRVGVGSTWHVEFGGVPESEQQQRDGGARTAVFYPRGGESLTVQATRPEASAGSTLAFDSVDLNIERGNRSSTASLVLDYRSTRGAQHVLRLPAGAEVTEVYLDGRPEPLRPEAGELTVPILPGEHVIQVGWRTAGEVEMRATTPLVDIGAPASNIALHLALPDSRWLLGTSGPPLGPAVLYWSELAVLLLFAVILGRVGLTPLQTRHWLLLGLGFSTFSWPVLGIVVAWLLACGARERWHGEAAWWQFDLIQALIAGATVIALVSIVGSLPGGLLGTPDMHVTGNNSYGNTLSWFADRSVSSLPTAAVWTVPMWAYKVLILMWALWLSFALLRWLPWVWQCFSSQGLWRSRKGAALRAPEGGE